MCGITILDLIKIKIKGVQLFFFLGGGGGGGVELIFVCFLMLFS